VCYSGSDSKPAGTPSVGSTACPAPAVSCRHRQLQAQSAASRALALPAAERGLGRVGGGAGLLASCIHALHAAPLLVGSSSQGKHAVPAVARAGMIDSSSQLMRLTRRHSSKAGGLPSIPQQCTPAQRQHSAAPLTHSLVRGARCPKRRLGRSTNGSACNNNTQRSIWPGG
jgi:hypothetical protein